MHIDNCLKCKWTKCSNQKTDWLNGYKKRPVYILSSRDHFRSRDTHRLKVSRWKKVFHANGNQKQAGVAILTSDKINFKIKTVTRDKEGHYIMIKESNQEDMTIVNIYAPNIGALQYIKQMLRAIKREINSNTLIVGDINTPLTSMYRSSRQKISKETQALHFLRTRIKNL